MTLAPPPRSAHDYLVAAAALMGLAGEVDDAASAQLAAHRAAQFEQEAALLPPAHRTEAWRAGSTRFGGVRFGWSCFDCPSAQSDLIDAVAAENAAAWHARHPDGIQTEHLVPPCGSELLGLTLLLVCDMPIGHASMHRMSRPAGPLPAISWRRAHG